MEALSDGKEPKYSHRNDPSTTDFRPEMGDNIELNIRDLELGCGYHRDIELESRKDHSALAFRFRTLLFSHPLLPQLGMLRLLIMALRA